MNAVTHTPLETLDAWLSENYPTLKASLRKTDIGYLIAAAMLKFGKFQRQEAAKEIAQFVEDQGIARTDNLLRALAARIREEYGVQP